MAELVNDILLSCTDYNRRGGIKSIYVANTTTITDFTADTTAHSYSAVTMDTTADKWFEIETDDEGASYEGTGTIKNSSSIQEVNIECRIPKLDRVKAKSIQELFNSCKVVVIFETYTGQGFVRGWDEFLGSDAGLRVAVTENLEAELQGNNQYTLTFSGKSGEIAREYIGSISLNQGGTKNFT